MFYVYTPDVKVKSAWIYETEEDAEVTRERLEAIGVEAHVCTFGYPFAPSY
jgi:hypothetical protein